MKKLFVLAVSYFLLSGCVSNPLPQGYDGPTATIWDSVLFETESSDPSWKPFTHPKATMFYLSHINGRYVDNSVEASNSANFGRGMFNMNPVSVSRKVPAQKATFAIVASNEYAASIYKMIKKSYGVTGNVTFQPEPDRVYEVKGILSEKHSAVWIEDFETKKPETEKIERRS